MRIQPLIVAADKIVNGVGSLDQINSLEVELLKLIGQDTPHKTVKHLVIDPLSSGWDTPLEQNHFRSGNGPIEALGQAYELISLGQADAVVIEGRDYLRSEYSRDDRIKLMQIYNNMDISAAYDLLAQRFIKGFQPPMLQQRFRNLADILFDNYLRTALKRGIDVSTISDSRGHEWLTPLFRLCDCANPYVDFEGKMIVTSEYIAEQLEVAPEKRVKLLGVAVKKLEFDGPDYVETIARYDHLSDAYNGACRIAEINFQTQFHRGNAFLEAYTCFPIVPLAFLLRSGIADSVEDIPRILEEHEITVTGGMGLARAAWNNPALNASIELCNRLVDGDKRYGGVHGNGGLGYSQGFAILERY